MKIIGRVLQSEESQYAPHLVAYIVSDKGINYIEPLDDVEQYARRKSIYNAESVNGVITGVGCNLDLLDSFIVNGTFSLVPFENKIAISQDGARYLKRHYKL